MIAKHDETIRTKTTSTSNPTGHYGRKVQRVLVFRILPFPIPSEYQRARAPTVVLPRSFSRTT